MSGANGMPGPAAGARLERGRLTFALDTPLRQLAAEVSGNGDLVVRSGGWGLLPDDGGGVALGRLPPREALRMLLPWTLEALLGRVGGDPQAAAAAALAAADAAYREPAAAFAAGTAEEASTLLACAVAVGLASGGLRRTGRRSVAIGLRPAPADGGAMRQPRLEVVSAALEPEWRAVVESIAAWADPRGCSRLAKRNGRILDPREPVAWGREGEVPPAQGEAMLRLWARAGGRRAG